MPTHPSSLILPGVQVWLCSRKWPRHVHAGRDAPPLIGANLYARPSPSRIHPDGSITFENGARAEHVDVIVYATGYRYSHPFLDDACGVGLRDKRQVGHAFVAQRILVYTFWLAPL